MKIKALAWGERWWGHRADTPWGQSYFIQQDPKETETSLVVTTNPFAGAGNDEEVLAKGVKDLAIAKSICESDYRDIVTACLEEVE